jgi:hypothetical protein
MTNLQSLPFPVLALPLLLVAALLDGACGASVASGAPNPASDDIVCAADSAACSTDVECCSYLCTGGTCGPPAYNCTEDNGECESDEICCSQVCTNAGFCAIPGAAGTCASEDAPCSSDAQCCSNACASSGTCTVGPEGCFNDFTACTGDGDCCSEMCTGGYCQQPPATCDGGPCPT